MCESYTEHLLVRPGQEARPGSRDPGGGFPKDGHTIGRRSRRATGAGVLWAALFWDVSYRNHLTVEKYHRENYQSNN